MSSQPRLYFPYDPGEEWRESDDKRHLRKLNQKIRDHAHVASTSRRKTRDRNTKDRYWRMVRNCR